MLNGKEELILVTYVMLLILRTLAQNWRCLPDSRSSSVTIRTTSKKTHSLCSKHTEEQLGIIP